MSASLILHSLFLLTVLIFNAFGAAAPTKKGVSGAVFEDLQRYAKYSVTAYKDLEDCVKPLNNTVLHRYDKKSTQGFLVRDDARKEYILAFRGTEPTKGDGDCSIDLNICKTNLSLPLVDNKDGAKIHTGFQKAWGFVSEQVVSDLMKELPTRAPYRLVITGVAAVTPAADLCLRMEHDIVGHSLGGALAAVSSLQIKKSFPNLVLKVYSYGAPRVGDLAFVKNIEKALGPENIFRGSNLQDPVSFLPPLLLGYRHFGTGYWLSTEPGLL